MNNFKCITPGCKERGNIVKKKNFFVKMNGEKHNVSKICEECGSQLVTLKTN